MAKRVGIVPYVFARPLLYELKKREGPGKPFEVVQELPAVLALKLRERNLDAAFLSPIDYAKDYAMYSIVPGVCASSKGASGAAFILFKENLRTVTTLAINSSSTSEIVLAHLIFAERYGSPPTIIPTVGTIEQALGKADGVLCAGDEALAYRGHPHRLDLVEEWDDLTGLPFVHGFWVTRRDSLTKSEVGAIIESSRPKNEKFPPGPDEVAYMNQFQYDMDADASAAIAEFFRMAYYHGILPDIPDVRFLELHENRGDPPIA